MSSKKWIIRYYY